ncbi:MAG: hemolysin family protein [Treponema sp.]|nr:hemolysin family protein [Spirochaetia bacterium]MDD7533067.1 hemolysin family protein [Treponema sp.]MDY3722462.1 hemolysin family protein [Treponema sp.]MDY5759125.1 hemolysin family protein [Treponema sp.]
MNHYLLTAAELFFLILCVGFFTSSETAYLSLPRLKLRSMVEQGRRNAKKVAALKANMDRLLTTVLIGTNFLNSLASAIATAFAIDLLGSRGVAIAPFVTAFFITTFAQIVPKTAAGLHPDTFTCFSAWPLMILEKLFFPIVWLFEMLSHGAVVLVEKILKPAGAIVTEEELKTLIDVGSHEGTIEKDESRLLNKIIKFNDLSVNDVMKHRSQVSMINQEADYDEVINQFLTSGFSTLTVYSGHRENVVGVLNYKKVLFCSEEIDKSKGFAGRQMSEVLFIPGTMSVLDILQQFRTSEHKFAVVLDEQGQTDGIITMEDILKVVFGHMSDENTYDNTAPEDKVELVSLNTFIVPGDMKIDDANEILGLALESDEMNTVGGWLLEQFGYLPASGTVLIKDRILFTAEDVSGRRIVSVRVKKSN